MIDQIRKLADPQNIHRIAQIIWGSSLLKLGSTLAIIGAAAITSIVQYVIIALFNYFGQSINIPDTPPWIGITLVVLGICTAALGSYLQRPLPPPGPNPHDVALLQTVRSKFSESELDFLRDHHFGSAFNFDRLAGTSDVAHWRGPKYEFVDNQVEAVFLPVKLSSQKMCDLVAAKTWPHHHMPNHQTALPDHHDEWNPSLTTQESIRDLNQAASELVASLTEFERIAKVRVPMDSSK